MTRWHWSQKHSGRAASCASRLVGASVLVCSCWPPLHSSHAARFISMIVFIASWTDAARTFRDVRLRPSHGTLAAIRFLWFWQSSILRCVVSAYVAATDSGAMRRFLFCRLRPWHFLAYAGRCSMLALFLLPQRFYRQPLYGSGSFMISTGNPVTPCASQT